MAYNKLEDEFKASQTYKVLKHAQDKLEESDVPQKIGRAIYNTIDQIQNEINDAAKTMPKKENVKVNNVKTKKAKSCPEGMMEVRQKSPAPFYIVALVAIVYALVFPLYRIFDYIAFAVICVLAGILASKTFKGKIVYVEKPKEEEKPKSRTGNEYADAVLNEGYKYIDELNLANDMIEDETVSLQIDRMVDVAKRIFEFVEANPEKAGQIRKFMNYYLPTTLKLLNSYFKLTRQNVDGKNISDTITEIERILYTIVKAFEKQLDALFQDEAIDVSTDITVLENMLKQEDLI